MATNVFRSRQVIEFIPEATYFGWYVGGCATSSSVEHFPTEQAQDDFVEQVRQALPESHQDDAERYAACLLLQSLNGEDWWLADEDEEIDEALFLRDDAPDWDKIIADLSMPTASK